MTLKGIINHCLMMLKIWRYSSQECTRWPSVAVHWHHWHSAELSTVQETWTHVEGNGFWCGTLIAFYPATFLAFVFLILDDTIAHNVCLTHWLLQQSYHVTISTVLWCIITVQFTLQQMFSEVVHVASLRRWVLNLALNCLRLMDGEQRCG